MATAAAAAAHVRRASTTHHPIDGEHSRAEQRAREP
jgi:hypothetical protein